ncbi:hypothetical protein A7K93_07275 [Candidatus Methylacidiphilum fumarolicum]|uniref:Organic solvent tolerance-like N-terminal domain-containing protein n=2 Tax=Candidatus Methylacidiphilum fumarolicum TaxID=591154 RepID=I0JWR8_METFB|nr:LptA/OstA family protein [Candidatus Methylacidiphilum fumarolicum]CCG91687.1 conserved exported hypothetical protein [Methylacidiphilum fumariolicum SolV]TFE67832.1 hypothetical protein A7K73_08365 [Candidatus Methylacidiphilum fumarolicum]TFE72982.1 hypothetical protein A7K93_07275 [Candidatus Methylacidiphilum fumarolicum]TFE75073.1 hypothetical protein A7K72_02460 [Candidatus Methylacidiphilum fumarolicum]
MKKNPKFHRAMKSFLLLLLFFFLRLNVFGQFPEENPPELLSNPDATVVTSNTFRMDQNNHQGFFSGNVITIANNFKMRSNEMTVFFDESGSEIKRLIAKGDAVLIQEKRTAKASQMEYIVPEDKLILTGNPEVIEENKDHVTGNVITIFRNTNQMFVDGHSRVILLRNNQPQEQQQKK